MIALTVDLEAVVEEAAAVASVPAVAAATMEAVVITAAKADILPVNAKSEVNVVAEVAVAAEVAVVVSEAIESATTVVHLAT